MSDTELALVSAAPPCPNSGVALSPWCSSRWKRAMDFMGALALVPVVIPLMGLIALLIKMNSRGPVLFRQRRIGKGGPVFQLLKFRTMYHGRSHAGSGLTRRGDSRITSVGRLLRRCKLDELPQLFNVLRGEMSLVGPRPDLPAYFEGLDGDLRRVLDLRPGITGTASLKFRNEEVLLAQVPTDQLEAFYVKTLLPQKIELELEYARNASLFSDAAMLLRTAAALFQ